MDQTGALRLSGRADGAGARASAARDAGIRVDLVLARAFADRADRTLVCTRAARDAIIADLICHGIHLLNQVTSLYPVRNEKAIARRKD